VHSGLNIRNNDTAGRVLTVEPLGVVLERPLEAERLATGSQIVEVRAEDDGVGLGEFGVRAGVKSRQVPRIALLDPDCRRIVRGVVGALRDAHADAGNELVARQVSQIALQENVIQETRSDWD